MSTTISKYTYKPTSYIPPISLLGSLLRRDSAITFRNDNDDLPSNIPYVSPNAQIHVFAQYLFTPGPLHRAPTLLSAVSDDTLLRGIKMLHQRVDDLIALDLKMYRTYASMLSDKEYAKVALTRTEWRWSAVSESVLGVLERDDMEELLARDLKVYNCVAESVWKWKGKVDGRIRRRRVERETALGGLMNCMCVRRRNGES
jgi:hypothetical protein